jgi:hypothetical protein
MSETTFDGTLIPETSFETLRSEDSLAKRVDAFGAEKPTISRTFHIAGVVFFGAGCNFGPAVLY